MVTGSLVLCGVIWIELKFEDSTTSVADALKLLNCAVIVVEPADCPVATPPAATVAILLFDEDQLTNWLIDSLVPSLKLPLAPYCTTDPGAISVFPGCSESPVSVPESTVKGTDPIAVAPFAVNVALIVTFPALAPNAVPKLP